MKTIMVQMSDYAWTMEAMHYACALARNLEGQVILLRLSYINNPGLLGWQVLPPTPYEYEEMKEYAAVAEDYGIAFSAQPMQFVSLIGALVQASAGLEACVLFAHLPPSRFSFWHKFRLWQLKHQLQNCHLYTLDEPPALRADAIQTVLEEVKTEQVAEQLV